MSPEPFVSCAQAPPAKGRDGLWGREWWLSYFNIPAIEEPSLQVPIFPTLDPFHFFFSETSLIVTVVSLASLSKSSNSIYNSNT